MNNNTNIVIILFFLALFLGFSAAEAESAVVIKVRAINPLDEEAPVVIHYPLPAGISPADVIGKRLARGRGPAAPADFQINFDDGEKIYFLDHQITLAPKEIVVLEVEANDVWVIPQETLDGFKRQVEELLQSRPPAPEGEPGPDPVVLKLKEEIFKQLEQVLKTQKESGITQAGVQGHIDAYQKNRETLQQVGMDITMLRNMLSAQEAPPEGENSGDGSEMRAETPSSSAAPESAPAPVDVIAPPSAQQTIAEKLKSLFKWK